MMHIFLHEIKRGKFGVLTWSLVIGGMIMLCILLFPELTKEGASIQAAIESMGTFTAAFGADRLSYGELMGFYGIYGGACLGSVVSFMQRCWEQGCWKRRNVSIRQNSF